MAYILPYLSPTLLQPKDRPSHVLPSPVSPLSPRPKPDSQAQPRSVAQVSAPPGAQDKLQRNDFYLNLGSAVRTLREDLPLLFTRDLNYQIYRDDITFSDSLNTFAGIEKYRLIFWALRFHGKILFREISVDVVRVWQPCESMILVRWNLRGMPRVPWEASGEFQGTSRYKVDRDGKIYEHRVDNLAFNFPQQVKPSAFVLDLVAACPATTNPTFSWGPVDGYWCSWVELYKAVKETVDREEAVAVAVAQDCFAAFL